MTSFRLDDEGLALHARMLDRGIYLPPSALEVWFLSLAHSDADIDRLAAALLAESSWLEARTPGAGAE